jgi:hypothetical protein
MFDQLQKDKKNLLQNYAREFTAAATGFFVWLSAVQYWVGLLLYSVLLGVILLSGT